MGRIEPIHARDLFEWIEGLNLRRVLRGSAGARRRRLLRHARLDSGARRTPAIAPTPCIFWSTARGAPISRRKFRARARTIQRFRQGPIETYLEGLLRLILEGSSLDAAGFSSAALDIVSRVTDLQMADTAIGVTGFTAMDALRTYLVAQLKAPRCADNVSATVTPSTFNAARRRARADADISTIEPDLTRPQSTLGPARIDMYWQSGDAARLHDAMARLRGPDKAPLPLRGAWRSQADRLFTRSSNGAE
jgi:hypothetical protein